MNITDGSVINILIAAFFITLIIIVLMADRHD